MKSVWSSLSSPTEPSWSRLNVDHLSTFLHLLSSWENNISQQVIEVKGDLSEIADHWKSAVNWPRCGSLLGAWEYRPAHGERCLLRSGPTDCHSPRLNRNNTGLWYSGSTEPLERARYSLARDAFTGLTWLLLYPFPPYFLIIFGNHNPELEMCCSLKAGYQNKINALVWQLILWLMGSKKGNRLEERASCVLHTEVQPWVCHSLVCRSLGSFP